MQTTKVNTKFNFSLDFEILIEAFSCENKIPEDKIEAIKKEAFEAIKKKLVCDIHCKVLEQYYKEVETESVGKIYVNFDPNLIEK